MYITGPGPGLPRWPVWYRGRPYLSGGQEARLRAVANTPSWPGGTCTTTTTCAGWTLRNRPCQQRTPTAADLRTVLAAAVCAPGIEDSCASVSAGWSSCDDARGLLIETAHSSVDASGRGPPAAGRALGLERGALLRPAPHRQTVREQLSRTLGLTRSCAQGHDSSCGASVEERRVDTRDRYVVNGRYTLALPPCCGAREASARGSGPSHTYLVPSGGTWNVVWCFGVFVHEVVETLERRQPHHVVEPVHEVHCR